MTKCYLCKSNKCEKIRNVDNHNFKTSVYICRNCDLVFLDPMMTEEEERHFYSKGQYDKNYNTEDDDTPEKTYNFQLPEAKIRRERFKDILKGDILEIGCSSGYFLDVCKDDVESVTGVELRPEFIEYTQALGVDVVDSLDKLDEKFDVIFMFHVLEHLSNPISFLKKVKKYLKKNGRLICEVPNVHDALISLYNITNFEKTYFHPAHNFYFSKHTLNSILVKAGFKSKIIPIQRYDLSNHMKWMRDGRPKGDGCYNDVFSNLLLDEYDDCLKKVYLCDTIYSVSYVR